MVTKIELQFIGHGIKRLAIRQVIGSRPPNFTQIRLLLHQIISKEMGEFLIRKLLWVPSIMARVEIFIPFSLGWKNTPLKGFPCPRLVCSIFVMRSLLSGVNGMSLIKFYQRPLTRVLLKHSVLVVYY